VLTIHIHSTDGYPPTVNSYPQCNAVVNKAAETVVGAARTGRPQKTMGAEDFSYFLQERPGMCRLVIALLAVRRVLLSCEYIPSWVTFICEKCFPPL
jgi:metal-dependent amidase/aminoacylase/carboxypeptidase family protein